MGPFPGCREQHCIPSWQCICRGPSPCEHTLRPRLVHVLQAKAKGCFTKALEAAGADVINLASDDSAEGAPSHKRRTHKPKRLLRLPAMPPQAQQRCATSLSGCAASLSQQLAARTRQSCSVSIAAGSDCLDLCN